MSNSQHNEGLSKSNNPTLTQGGRSGVSPSTHSVASRTISSNPPATMYETNRSRRNHPHLTDYNLTGSKGTICRCANPESHGDAFTRNCNFTKLRDINGRIIPTWIEARHRELDVLGKDSATLEETKAVAHRVFDYDWAEHFTFKFRKAVASTEEEGDDWWLEDTVTWYGNVNPRGFTMIPAEWWGEPVNIVRDALESRRLGAERAAAAANNP